jgi:glycosyltransferase involved in cell wall biosynthesis
MVAYTFYEMDNRVRRYAEALVKRGDHVDAFCLQRVGQPEKGMLNGVHVYRIQKRAMNEKHKVSYLLRLLRFFVKTAYLLAKTHLKNPYELIHVHSVPDFEIFAAFVPKMAGAKIILDIHDIVPEFYASKFHVRHDTWVFKALVLVERLSAKFADHVLISNDIWLKTLTRRSMKMEKCTVVLNYPDPSLFAPRPRLRNDDRFIMMYPGTIGWHQGLDIAIRAFDLIRESIPNAELHIYGEGNQKDLLAELVAKLGLQGRVFLNDNVPMEQIADVMANADVGVVPKRNDAFGGEAFSTKIFEFMTLGIPVIVSETKVDRHYFNNEIVQFFRPEDADDLGRCMLLLAKDKELRERIASNALKYVDEFSWDKRKGDYFEIVDRLVGRTQGIQC